MPFEVASDQFSGPLHLLLDLVDRKQLPITEISLSQITDDYIKYLDAHTVPPEELADFLVIASTLLLMKSRAILPQLALEEEGPDLTSQLALYKEFVEIAKQMDVQYGKHLMLARARSSMPKLEGFYPPQDLTLFTLEQTFGAVLKRLEPFFALEAQSMQRVVSVQERIEHIRSAILERSKLSFGDLTRSAKSKVDVVVSFLALLELMKQRLVKVVQKESFQDIMISHVK
jgi:segregation and condensation protein A